MNKAMNIQEQAQRKSMMTTPFVPTHAAFFLTAERAPAAPALIEASGVTSYSALAERAGAVAAGLRQRGIGRGTIVPVLSSRPAEVIAGMLGAWSIGAVPAPLDATAPFEQVLQRLFVISPEWILEGTLPDDVEVQLDERYSVPGRISFAEIVDNARQTPAVGIDADDPAYLTFTSGSTGTPKGIVGRHTGITHFLDWERERTGASEGTRVSVLTSPAFDAFFRDAFLPLTSGGTAVIPTASERQDASALLTWIAAHEIHVTHMVPTLFATLVDAVERSGTALPALEWVLLSGEILRPELVARWQALPGVHARIINLYGPSETTMTKLFHVVDERDAMRASVPIGAPMPGVGVVLLNEAGRPVADGLAGELVIRTPYMSLGYYNAPNETKERFVPNPLRDDPEDVVYRTGDRARRWPEGELEFLGRTDRQVKRAGVRIELDEIEGLFAQAPGVREAAVMAWPSKGGDRDDTYLAAYVVPDGKLDPAVVRSFLARRLPEQALPAVVTPIDALPRTISGKVDRTALPEPVATRTGPAVTPRTPTEEIVLGLWKRVLPTAIDVGVTDDFFEVGGHSLLVMRLLSLLNDELGAQVQLGDFLRRPTVEALAELVEDEMMADLSSDDSLLSELLEDRTSSGIEA